LAKQFADSQADPIGCTAYTLQSNRSKQTNNLPQGEYSVAQVRKVRDRRILISHCTSLPEVVRTPRFLCAERPEIGDNPYRRTRFRNLMFPSSHAELLLSDRDKSTYGKNSILFVAIRIPKQRLSQLHPNEPGKSPQEAGEGQQH
jgi:hypothetical protein